MSQSTLYRHVPIFHQATWNSSSNPHLGLVHEFGFHIQHHSQVSQEDFAKVYHQMCNQEQHMPPVAKLQNLQCKCINILHQTFGVKLTTHYRLHPDIHTPFLFFNRYTYHVYYKDITNSSKSTSLFETTLLMKYGVDFKAPIVQQCFLSHEPVSDLEALRYSLYHIYRRTQEIASRFSDCIVLGCANCTIQCICQTCQILDALYYLIRKSGRVYVKRHLTLHGQQFPPWPRLFIKYVS